jgi:hypothetical protein
MNAKRTLQSENVEKEQQSPPFLSSRTSIGTEVKLTTIKAARDLANELTTRGAALYEQLAAEVENRVRYFVKQYVSYIFLTI